MLRGNERKDIFIDEEDKREMKEFTKKEDSYFNWTKSGNGKNSVKRTVPLTSP